MLNNFTNCPICGKLLIESNHTPNYANCGEIFHYEGKINDFEYIYFKDYNLYFDRSEVAIYVNCLRNSWIFYQPLFLSDLDSLEKVTVLIQNYELMK